MIHNDIAFMNTFLMGNVIKGTDDLRVIKNNIMKSISFLSPNTSSEEKKKRKRK